MPVWVALLLGLAGAAIAGAGLIEPEQLRAGWTAARGRWRDRRGRRAALRQLERDGWHRP